DRSVVRIDRGDLGRSGAVGTDNYLAAGVSTSGQEGDHTVVVDCEPVVEGPVRRIRIHRLVRQEQLRGTVRLEQPDLQLARSVAGGGNLRRNLCVVVGGRLIEVRERAVRVDSVVA